MSITDLEAFYKKLLNNKVLIEEFEDTINRYFNGSYEDKEQFKAFITNELIPFAKLNGYNIDLKDIINYESDSKALSEEELMLVNGGIGKRAAIPLVAFSMLAGIIPMHKYMNDLNQSNLNINTNLDNHSQLFTLDSSMIGDLNENFSGILKSDNSNNIDLDKYIFKESQNSQTDAINKETNDIKSNNNYDIDILTDNNQNQSSINLDDNQNQDQDFTKKQNSTHYSKSDIERFKLVQHSYKGYFGDHSNNINHREEYLRLSEIDKNLLTQDELLAFSRYVTDSTEINASLRQKKYYNDDIDKVISNMKGAFANHQLPSDITVYRGVTDTFIVRVFKSFNLSEEELSKVFNEDGTLNHKSILENDIYLNLEGVVFKDEAFVSTTTNEFFANRWANKLVHKSLANKYVQQGETEKANEICSYKERYNDIEGSHVMSIYVPEGANAMFTDTMYLKENRSRGQNELTLDSGYYYKISKVELLEQGRYKLYIELLQDA